MLLHTDQETEVQRGKAVEQVGPQAEAPLLRLALLKDGRDLLVLVQVAVSCKERTARDYGEFE